MKKIFLVFITILTFCHLSNAQNDTMYIMKLGSVIGKYKLSDVDSVVFYKPSISPLNIELVTIPAGTFTMGSDTSEVNHGGDEPQFQVTLSAFKMSKYEITNAQYAAFLNEKHIGFYGTYPEGAYPNEELICESGYFGDSGWGLDYNTVGQMGADSRIRKLPCYLCNLVRCCRVCHLCWRSFTY